MKKYLFLIAGLVATSYASIQLSAVAQSSHGSVMKIEETESDRHPFKISGFDELPHEVKVTEYKDSTDGKMGGVIIAITTILNTLLVALFTHLNERERTKRESARALETAKP